jgi:hypothetical protein
MIIEIYSLEHKPNFYLEISSNVLAYIHNLSKATLNQETINDSLDLFVTTRAKINWDLPFKLNEIGPTEHDLDFIDHLATGVGFYEKLCYYIDKYNIDITIKCFDTNIFMYDNITSKLIKDKVIKIELL